MAAPTYQFANNANTILAAPINTVATSLQVSAGTGAIFPTPTANQPFLLTLIDAATQTVNEIVLVTQRAVDVLTIVRGQEGTIAKSWLGGDICANLVTAGTFQNMEQIPQAQAAAHNWAQDTGGVNSYVAAYSPTITQRIQGMTLRMKIANSNTGPSTLDIGAGPSPWVNPDGSDLGAGALIAGGWAEFVDNVTNYQLISSSQQAQSSAGAATTGDFKWRPTSETVAGWVVANATTIGNAASNATQLASAVAANLFAWHWNNFPNTQCPVFTSAGVPTTRGANAAADFAANKQIQVYDKRGHGVIGVDTMGGSPTNRLAGVPVAIGSSTTPGSVLGENVHTLTAGEAPTITSNGVNFISVTTTRSDIGLGNSPNTTGGGAFGFNTPAGFGAVTSTGSAAIAVTSNNTGGGAHNTVDLCDTGYWWIKL
ncbi:hypothetical protein [Bradyrhizobium sp. CCGUVB14]|uniref:hypothetical protein n=1 Tax=Bradyrhizobium sp. CCGUVB14 TaxID=2949628 RepID=UPI0020B421DB|nr:hypothetical protein [Bradyrhizobium sp. CCGUVB14]MCP3444592.1 hypothetical protein [Bradyrhizobium sp. CCGUVB14]